MDSFAAMLFDGLTETNKRYRDRLFIKCPNCGQLVEKSKLVTGIFHTNCDADWGDRRRRDREKCE